MIAGPGAAPTAAVLHAVEEVRARFPSTAWVGDGTGGAFVIADQVPLGPPFAQDRTWVGFHVTAMCPYADVYPHYVRADLSFADGRALTVPLHGGNCFPAGVPVAALPTRPAVMVSRVSHRRESNSALETPLLKLLKVLECMKSL